MSGFAAFLSFMTVNEESFKLFVGLKKQVEHFSQFLDSLDETIQ